MRVLVAVLVFVGVLVRMLRMAALGVELQVDVRMSPVAMLVVDERSARNDGDRQQEEERDDETRATRESRIEQRPFRSLAHRLHVAISANRGYLVSMTVTPVQVGGGGSTAKRAQRSR